MQPKINQDEWRYKYGQIRELAKTLKPLKDVKNCKSICSIEAQKAGIKCLECEENG